MTTRLELEHQGETIVVTGQYFPQAPTEFVILKVEHNGLDVTNHYLQHRMISALEDMAREMIEGD